MHRLGSALAGIHPAVVAAGLAGVAILGIVPASNGAAAATEVVAVSGDTPPDANGKFSLFGGPVLNDKGEVAFVGVLSGTTGGSADNAGLYRDDGLTLVEVLRKGQYAPDDNGAFSDFGAPAINEAGQEAFLGVLARTTGGTDDNQGIFRGDGVTLVQVAREGQAAPDNDGAFATFDDFPTLNNAGQVAFYATLRGTAFENVGSTGIFRGDGTALVQIARQSQDAPDDGGKFDGFGRPTVNDAGQVAFGGVLTNNSEGIFRGDDATLVQVARTGQAAPGGGNFTTFLAPALNDVGQVAFTGGVTTDGTNDLGGVFRGDGATLVQIAREGQSAPDGNGTFATGLGVPTVNDAGQVVFHGRFTGTSGGDTDDSSILRGDGLTLEQVVREGQASPDGNGVFAGFIDPALNDAGQVAFFAILTGTDGGRSDDNGIFFFDDALGLLTVVREGDELLGSTITSLLLESSLASRNDQRSGLNDLGQVAYRFTLADGRQGLAVTLVPEPGAIGLLALGGFGLLRRRRQQP